MLEKGNWIGRRLSQCPAQSFEPIRKIEERNRLREASAPRSLIARASESRCCSMSAGGKSRGSNAACRPPRELVPASDRFLVCHECDYVALKAPHLSSLCWVADFLSGKLSLNRISTSSFSNLDHTPHLAFACRRLACQMTQVRPILIYICLYAQPYGMISKFRR